MTSQKHIAILGSTGSIGTQTLDIIKNNPDKFKVNALTANNNKKLLFEQVAKFKPNYAGFTDSKITIKDIPDELKFCKWSFGNNVLNQAANREDVEEVVVSVVGMCGLESVITALENHKKVLLANKEALVAGGNIVMKLANQNADKNMLLPIDSEHSAIFQCLQGSNENKINKILLTCSGGPFRTWGKEEIANATVLDALKHPTWSMGRKITVDSATLFNKALEMVEAHYLFDIDFNKIEVLIHPQSIIHSAVEYIDGAVIAQMGTPDMHIPIAYALSYPERIKLEGNKLDLFKQRQLTFEKPDEEKFRSLKIVKECMVQGGASCCIMNAANEIAVNKFLENNKSMTVEQIYIIVEETLNKIGYLPADTLEQVLYADEKARQIAKTL